MKAKTWKIFLVRIFDQKFYNIYFEVLGYKTDVQKVKA